MKSWKKLKNTLVSDDELQMVRARAKMRLLNSLSSNQSLAIAMATPQQRFGDWRSVPSRRSHRQSDQRRHSARGQKRCLSTIAPQRIESTGGEVSMKTANSSIKTGLPRAWFSRMTGNGDCHRPVVVKSDWRQISRRRCAS